MAADGESARHRWLRFAMSRDMRPNVRLDQECVDPHSSPAHGLGCPAGRHFGMSRESVRKVLSFSAPPGYRRTATSSPPSGLQSLPLTQSPKSANDCRYGPSRTASGISHQNSHHADSFRHDFRVPPLPCARAGRHGVVPSLDVSWLRENGLERLSGRRPDEASGPIP